MTENNKEELNKLFGSDIFESARAHIDQCECEMKNKTQGIEALELKNTDGEQEHFDMLKAAAILHGLSVIGKMINEKPMPPEFSKTVDGHFWELI